MKVITQLIRHFWQRGALTSAEIEYLLRHDFVQPRDLPGYVPRKQSPHEDNLRTRAVVLEPPEPLEQIEESLVRRRPDRRRGAGEARKEELHVHDLCERLRGEFQRRDVDLASVLALGQRFEAVDTWSAAASELRDVTPQRFHRGLCAELREGDVLLGDVWQASDPEPFHLLIDDEEARGRAARSFLALLVATGPDALGKYSWILKYDEMQAVINLRVLHRRLLESLARIYRRDRLLLTQSLAKNSDPAQVWSLVILYNAHRSAKLGNQPQYGSDYGPVPAPDDYELWKHAWTAALRMDRPRVTEFLVACYQHLANQDENSEPPIGLGNCSQRAFFCPVGWHLP